MDDSDLVFVPSVSHSSDGEGAVEVFEDFEDLKEAAEVKPEEFQVIDHNPQIMFFINPTNISLYSCNLTFMTTISLQQQPLAHSDRHLKKISMKSILQ